MIEKQVYQDTMRVNLECDVALPVHLFSTSTQLFKTLNPKFNTAVIYVGRSTENGTEVLNLNLAS